MTNLTDEHLRNLLWKLHEEWDRQNNIKEQTQLIEQFGSEISYLSGKVFGIMDTFMTNLDKFPFMKKEGK